MSGGKGIFALCVGHSRPGDMGAVAADNKTTEHEYNVRLARYTKRLLDAIGVPCVAIEKYEGANYGAAMRWLAGKLSALGAAGVVELHFNSADSPRARGHEMLYCAGSKEGRALALALNGELAAFPSIPDRGVKCLSPADRGYGFVSRVRPPAVISEAFIGSSREDWERVNDPEEVEALAEALAGGIAKWWKGMGL